MSLDSVSEGFFNRQRISLTRRTRMGVWIVVREREPGVEPGICRRRSKVPSFIPRNLEPYCKRELFDRRVLQLRGAVNSGASAARVSNAAEKVRLAALAVVKARRAQLAGNDRTRQLRNLQKEQEWWSSLSPAAIVAQFTEGRA